MQGRTNAITGEAGGTSKNGACLSSIPIDFGEIVISRSVGSGVSIGGMITPSVNNFIATGTINYDMGFFPSDLTFIEE